MAFGVFQQPAFDGLFRSLGIFHRGYRLVLGQKLLPTAGNGLLDLVGLPSQFFSEKSPVTDDGRPAFGHTPGKIGQNRQKRGVFLLHPQDFGLVLQQFVVFSQSQSIPGPQLAQSGVQKPSSGRRAFPDQIQIFWGKKHTAKHFRQIALPFLFDAIDDALQLPRAEQSQIHAEFPLPGKDLGLDLRLALVKGDQVSPFSRPPGPAAGEKKYGLQQVGFSLGIFSRQDGDPFWKRKGSILVVAKMAQANGF